ncbi:glycosyltransferase [Ancylobacter oerskovii]|uniref:Glycosyltransferase n=1 Tax=Ancylobacter oerskovii TaxID=459519 RepID=A0ABW4Z2Y3_9HYPH|nr:glycosyltransferase [Ancylobacter oerskovii]MBS7546173.1 glycosyltransferase [Ancylobacter oerskovii]
MRHIAVTGSSRSNPYMDLLLSCCPPSVTVSRISNKKIAQINEAPIPEVVLINWEEQIFSGVDSAFQARSVATRYIRDLRKYAQSGGRIVWMVHNAHPHSDLFTHHLEMMRKKIMQAASAILHQNIESLRYVDTLDAGIDPERHYFLPHPSYLKAYELRPSFEAARNAVLIFGRILPYKNLEWFVRFHELHIPKTPLVIAGQSDDEKYVDYLRKSVAQNKRITLVADRIEDADLPLYFDRAKCILLTDHDTINSGVAHVALQGGAVIVAPDTAYYREVIPPAGHRFFYQPNSFMSLKKAVRNAFKLEPEPHRQLVGSYMRRAAYINSDRISSALFGIFEGLAGKPAPGESDPEQEPQQEQPEEHIAS